MSKTLTIEQIKAAAAVSGINQAAIRAVIAVESSGRGFTEDGRLVIRYEPHIFSRLTDGKYDKEIPDASFPQWRPGYPKSINHSYELLEKAAQKDPYRAGLSCSYGLFQIMGFNFSRCGCKTFKEFYTRMGKSEAEQLDLFFMFIKASGLYDELKSQDWAGFALGYNGKQYKVNKYDTNLKKAYDKFSLQA